MVNLTVATATITRVLTDEGIVAGAGSCELAPIAAETNVFRAMVNDLGGNVRLYRVPGATVDEVVRSLLAAVGRG